MWSLKVSWSSKISPRFLTEFDGVIVEEPSWMVKSCCRVGVAGKTRSKLTRPEPHREYMEYCQEENEKQETEKCR